MRPSRLCVTSELANLAAIAEFVTEHAAALGVSDDHAYEIQMAVDEACTNVMEHAYEGRPDGPVMVRCYVDDGDFVVEIRDHGKQFDPDLVPTPNLDTPIEERNIGGLGLYFMRQLMDQVSFASERSTGNVVTMRKHCLGALT